MLLIPAVGPDPSRACVRQFLVEHLHARIVGPDDLGLEQHFLGCPIQRLHQIGDLPHPTAHCLGRDLHSMPLEDLILPVQRHMVGRLGYDHLGQQTGASGALFNRLRRLGGSLHCALAGILLADILDDYHLRWDVFIALARLFADGPQVLRAHRTVLFLILQIVHDPFPLEMRGQRLPAAAILLLLLGRGI